MLTKTRDSSVATPPRRAHAVATATLLLAACGTLAGCGQKGPLTLPGTLPETSVTPVDAPAPVPPAPAGAASAPLRP